MRPSPIAFFDARSHADWDHSSSCNRDRVLSDGVRVSAQGVSQGGAGAGQSAQGQ